jgi:GNAT superfamily N-acetyltransferase
MPMLSLTDLRIVPATPADAPAVNDFVQPIYARTYPNSKYGLKPEHFSPKIFASPRILQYTESVLTSTNHQRAYLAKLHGQIVGCISLERLPSYYELRAFYVDPKLQGQGIGKRLLIKALEFYAGDLLLRIEVAETNAETIALYQHWGFQPTPHSGLHLRHWPEWPAGLQNGYIYLEATKETIHVRT